MSKIKILILAIMTLFIMCSCPTGPDATKNLPLNPYDDFPPMFPGDIGEKPPEEETPPPSDNPTPTPKKVTTIQAKILEYNKATKVVYINVGSSTKGIKDGLVGKIYNDKALTQENGSVQITKVYPSYAEGLASNQNYEIDPKAAIAVFTIEN